MTLVRDLMGEIGLADLPVPAGRYRRVRQGLKGALARHPRLFVPLRRAVLRVRGLGEEARFVTWRGWSRWRFGETRWLSVHSADRILVRTDDRRSFMVWASGGTQKAEVAVWRQLAALRPDVCVDVGANYGEFTCALGDVGVPVLALEPNPAVLACLRQSLAGRENITLVPAAASDVEGTAHLHLHATSSGQGSLLASPGSRVEVATRRLDRLVPEVIGRQPSSLVVKIDVEGHEVEVMRGAQGMLAGARWWRALVEFNAALLEDAARVWKTWRQYPGIVIGSGDVAAIPTNALPLAPPRPKCDIVIGEGAP